MAVLPAEAKVPNMTLGGLGDAGASGSGAFARVPPADRGAMTDTADELLCGIGAIYQRWLAGEISQEDALFAIGDRLGETPAADAAEVKSGAQPND
jgi:hypothetical protein